MLGVVGAEVERDGDRIGQDHGRGDGRGDRGETPPRRTRQADRQEHEAEDHVLGPGERRQAVEHAPGGRPPEPQQEQNGEQQPVDGLAVRRRREQQLAEVERQESAEQGGVGQARTHQQVDDGVGGGVEKSHQELGAQVAGGLRRHDPPQRHQEPARQRRMEGQAGVERSAFHQAPCLVQVVEAVADEEGGRRGVLEEDQVRHEAPGEDPPGHRGLRLRLRRRGLRCGLARLLRPAAFLSHPSPSSPSWRESTYYRGPMLTCVRRPWR